MLQIKYTQDDLKNYIKILFNVNYKNNDRVLVNLNLVREISRYMNLTVGIWHNRNKVQGSGIKKENRI